MRQSIRHRRQRKKINKDFELQLTSMMDMLIILIVFMLKSYSTDAVAFSASSNIQLPYSSTEETPGDAINLAIDPQQILIDNEPVMQFKLPPGTDPKTLKADLATYEIEPHLVADAGRRILPIYDALVKSREKTELLMSKAVWKDKDGKVSATPPKFHGTLVIQADKSVRYELLRKIMYTAGAAEFKTFKLVTVRKEEG